MYKITLKKTIKHFKLITKHKWYVFQYCCKAGIVWRGIKHDLSKYSPTEFWESVKYYTGDRSPIENCKDDVGVSKAWLHHKGRNSHHYEYWQDNFDKGGSPIQMPVDDAIECLCDSLAAARAYMGKNFSFDAEYQWWLNKTANPIAMHPQTKAFMYLMLRTMKVQNILALDNCYCRICYELAKQICESPTWEETFRNEFN